MEVSVFRARTRQPMRRNSSVRIAIFIALDLEYSRVVAARLQDTEGSERDAIRNAAKDLIPFRDKCVNDNDNPANSAPRSMQLQCLQKWYYGRIAELSGSLFHEPTSFT